MKNLNINDENFEFSPEAASQTLKNVFEACEKPQNTIPLELLESKQKTQTRLYRIGNTIAAIGLAIVTFAIISFLLNGWDYDLTRREKTEPALEQMAEIEFPKITSAYIKDENCIIRLKDGTYPIIYEEIYARNVDTEEELVVTITDKAIYIPYSKKYSQIEIIVPDTQGSRCVLTLQVEKP